MSQSSLRPRASLLAHVQNATPNGSPAATPNKPKKSPRARNGNASAGVDVDKDLITELITSGSGRIAYDYSGLPGVNNFRKVVLDGTVTHFMRCFSCRETVTMLKHRAGCRVADYLRHNKRKGHSNDDDCDDVPEAKVDANAIFKTKHDANGVSKGGANGAAKGDAHVSSDDENESGSGGSSAESESEEDDKVSDAREVFTQKEDKKDAIKKETATPKVTQSPRQFMLRTKPIPKPTPQPVPKVTPAKRKVSFSAKVEQKHGDYIHDNDVKELQVKKLKAEIAESQARAEREKEVQSQTLKNIEKMGKDNEKFFNQINVNLREIISGINVLINKIGVNGNKAVNAKPVVTDAVQVATEAPAAPSN